MQLGCSECDIYTNVVVLDLMVNMDATLNNTKIEVEFSLYFLLNLDLDLVAVCIYSK